MINFKKYNIVLLVSSVMLLFTSCDLDVESPNDLTEDETNASLLAVGMYQAYQKVYANEYIISELRSDNARSESGGGDNGLADTYSIPNNFNDGRAYWVNNYSVILNANRILIDEEELVAQDLDNPDRVRTSGRQALAEAYFMRALSHFNLVRAFRRVPYIDAVILNPDDILLFDTLAFNENFDAALQEVYTRIINDFNSSINFFNAVNDGSVVRNKANLPAAYGFLVKALLSQPNKDFTTAFSILNTHLHPDTNVFGLELVDVNLDDIAEGIQDYLSIFQGNELNEEILFAVSYEGGNFNDVVNQDFNIDDQVQGDAQEWSRGMSEFGQGNGLIFSSELLDNFIFVNDVAAGIIPEPIRGGDLSQLEEGNLFGNTEVFGTVIDDDGVELITQNFTGTTGLVQERNRDYYDAKFRDTAEGSGVDGIVLRYADILLLFSEALAGGNDTADAVAIDMYNRVRARVGADPLDTPFLTQQALLDERRIELCFENQRLWDIIRFNADDGTNLLREFTLTPDRIQESDGFQFLTGRQFLPIPSVEIGLTGGIDVTYTQNASY